MSASKAQVVQAIKAINEFFGEEAARLIDWSDCGDGYAINLEDSLAEYYAEDIAADGTIHGALPRGTFLEPINNVSLRLVRA